MPELAQISMTDENSKCLDILKNSGYFNDQQDAARFAASLALRLKLYEGVDMMNVGSNMTTKWGTSLVDPDYFFRNIVKALNICPEDAGVGLRSLIILGLDYIYSNIKDQEIVFLGELLNDI